MELHISSAGQLWEASMKIPLCHPLTVPLTIHVNDRFISKKSFLCLKGCSGFFWTMPPSAALALSEVMLYLGYLLKVNLCHCLALFDVCPYWNGWDTAKNSKKDPAQSCAAFAAGWGVSTKFLSNSTNCVEINLCINYSNYFQRYTFAPSPTHYIWLD